VPAASRARAALLPWRADGPINDAAGGGRPPRWVGISGHWAHGTDPSGPSTKKKRGRAAPGPFTPVLTGEFSWRSRLGGAGEGYHAATWQISAKKTCSSPCIYNAAGRRPIADGGALYPRFSASCSVRGSAAARPWLLSSVKRDRQCVRFFGGWLKEI